MFQQKIKNVALSAFPISQHNMTISKSQGCNIVQFWYNVKPIYIMISIPKSLEAELHPQKAFNIENHMMISHIEAILNGLCVVYVEQSFYKKSHHMLDLI